MKALIGCLAMISIVADSEPALAESKEPPRPQTGLLALGFHTQVGFGILETITNEPARAQVHPRLTLRYDTETNWSYRLTGRHQRLSGDGGGHAELTATPSILHTWTPAQDIQILVGLGLSLGAFTRFRPPDPDSTASERDFAIPVAGELAGSLSWQWRKALSLELGVDYRPIIFSEGDIEHVFTQSLSLSFDL